MEAYSEEFLKAYKQLIREHNGHFMQCQNYHRDGYEYFRLKRVHRSVWLIKSVTAGVVIGVFVGRVVIPKVEDRIRNHKKKT